MSEQESKKDNVNEGGNGKKTRISTEKETPEQKLKRVYQNRKAQYLIFRLAEILNVEPSDEEGMFMIFETDGVKFNLVDILEKALEIIEEK